jgi:hypothetical protein
MDARSPWAPPSSDPVGDGVPSPNAPPRDHGPDDSPPAPRGSNPVAVAYYPTIEEAHMAAARLQAEDVDAVVDAAYALGWLSHLQFGTHPRGVALLVPEAQLTAAQAVLDITPTPVEPGEMVGPLLRKADRAVLAAFICAAVPLLAPFMLLHLWSVRQEADGLRELLDEAARRRVRRSLVHASVLTTIGLAFLALLAVMVAYSL